MKTTKLPSVENLTKDWGMLKDLPNDLIDYDKYRVEDVQDLLTQDRNQAYTSLVEGIEGMKKYPVIGSSDQQIADSLWRNDTLTDVIANVVKPLYGKE